MAGEKNDRGIYPVAVIGIVILVMLAFIGPMIVFKLQDRYQTGRIWQGVRNRFDVEAIYETYGGLRERLGTYAERMDGGYEFYVAGTEYQRSAELLNMMDTVFGQMGYGMLEGYGFAPQMEEVKNRGYTVDLIKKYVIYNDISEGENSGLLISAWYIEFTTRQDVTVKLLADTETDTIYFAEITQPLTNSQTTDGMSYGKKAPADKKPISWVQYGYEDVVESDEWQGFWLDYYEAEQAVMQTLQWQKGEVAADEKRMMIKFRTGLEGIAHLIPELTGD